MYCTVYTYWMLFVTQQCILTFIKVYMNAWLKVQHFRIEFGLHDSMMPRVISKSRASVLSFVTYWMFRNSKYCIVWLPTLIKKKMFAGKELRGEIIACHEAAISRNTLSYPSLICSISYKWAIGRLISWLWCFQNIAQFVWPSDQSNTAHWLNQWWEFEAGVSVCLTNGGWWECTGDLFNNS